MTDSPVLSSRTLFTNNGIVGGGDLSGDRMFGLEPIYPKGSGPKATVDVYGRVIGLGGFSVTDFTETLGGMPVIDTRRINTLDGIVGGGVLGADLILSLEVIHPVRNGPVPVIDEHGRVTETRAFVAEDFAGLGGVPALNSTRIEPDSTMVGGGPLTGTIKLGLAPISQTGSGPRPAVDGFGRVVGWNELSSRDIVTALEYTPMNPALGLGDLPNPHQARINLGLGSAARLEADKPGGVPILDRNSRLPTAYFSAVLLGGLNYQGVWNARMNEPTLPGASSCRGAFYLVGQPGHTLVDGINDWEVGDVVISNGSAWEVVRGLLKP